MVKSPTLSFRASLSLAAAGAAFAVWALVAPDGIANAAVAADFTWQLTQLRADPSGAVVETNYDLVNESTTSPVTLNACTISVTYTAIETYRWSFSNGAPPITSSDCKANWQRPLS